MPKHKIHSVLGGQHAPVYPFIQLLIDFDEDVEAENQEGLDVKAI